MGGRGWVSCVVFMYTFCTTQAWSLSVGSCRSIQLDILAKTSIIISTEGHKTEQVYVCVVCVCVTRVSILCLYVYCQSEGAAHPWTV